MSRLNVFDMEPKEAIDYMDAEQPWIESFDTPDDASKDIAPHPQYLGGNVPSVGFILFGRFEQKAIKICSRVGQGIVAAAIISGAITGFPYESDEKPVLEPAATAEFISNPEVTD